MKIDGAVTAIISEYPFNGSKVTALNVFDHFIIDCHPLLFYCAQISEHNSFSYDRKTLQI